MIDIFGGFSYQHLDDLCSIGFVILFESPAFRKAVNLVHIFDCGHLFMTFSVTLHVCVRLWVGVIQNVK